MTRDERTAILDAAGKVADNPTSTAADLAKAARAALLARIDRDRTGGLSPLYEPHEIRGRYIDLLTVEERRYVARNAMYGPDVFERIDARVKAERQRPAEDKQPRARRTPKLPEAINLPTLQTPAKTEEDNENTMPAPKTSRTPRASDEEIRAQIEIARTFAEKVEALPQVTTGTLTYFNTARMPTEMWREAKNELARVSKHSFGSKAFNATLKYWRIPSVYAPYLRENLTAICVEVDGTTGEPLAKAPAKPAQAKQGANGQNVPAPAQNAPAANSLSLEGDEEELTDPFEGEDTDTGPDNLTDFAKLRGNTVQELATLPEETLKAEIKELFVTLQAADPKPAPPPLPDPDDYQTLEEYEKASDAYSAKTVSLMTENAGWATRRDKRRKNIAELEAQIEGVKAQAAATEALAKEKAEAKARKDALKANSQAALSSLNGARIIELDKGFIYDEEVSLLFELLEDQLTTDGYTENVLLTGPAGTGKTSLAEQFAARVGLPFVSVECAMVRDSLALFGHWTADATTGTKFVETLLTRAIEQGNCVLLVDEVNRFLDPSVANGLLPLLDHRRKAWIDDIQREIAIGENIAVFATRNQGGKFVGTTATDAALESRFGLFHETRHLSIQETTRLLTSKTPNLKPSDAEKLARLSDAIRNAYRQGTLSVCPGTREDIAAAKAFVKRGPKALRFTYANRFPFENIGSGAERTQVNALIQGAFPDY